MKAANKITRIFFGALVIAHVALLYHLSGFQDVITPDGYYYCAWTAQNNFPIIYPALIWVFRLIISNPQTAGTMVSMLAMCGNVILVYLIAKRYISQNWALAATVVFALAPISLRLGVIIMSESTYVLLILLSFYFFNRRNLLCGIFAGLAFLTRPEGAAFFAALVIYHFWNNRRFKDSLRLILSFVIIALIGSTTVWLFGGPFTLTRKSVANVGGAMSDLSAYHFDYLGNFGREAQSALQYMGIPLVGAFLISVWKKPTIVLLGCTMFLVFPLLSGYGNHWRFMFPYLPFVVISSFIFVSSIRRNLEIVFAVLMLVGFYDSIGLATMPEEPFVELKYTGEALKPYVNDSTILMAKKSYTAFYAGLRTDQFIDIPNVSLDELYAYLKDHQVTHLVISKRVMQIFRPQLIGLFDPEQRTIGKFGLIRVMFPMKEYETWILEPIGARSNREQKK